MLTCKNLAQLPSLRQLVCVAGRRGLNHTIRWTYIAESQTFSNWIHGGELLIVSGAIIKKPDFNLSDLINEAIGGGLSGALLLCGQDYIDQIPPNVIAAADKAAFPLLKIAWNTPLVDIVEEIGRAILNANQLSTQAEDIIHHLLFSEYGQTDFLLEQGQLIGYNLNGSQQMLLLRFTATSAEPSRETVREIVHTALTTAGLDHLTSAYYNNLIILCPAKAQDNLKQALTALQAALTKALPQIKFYIGIGSPCPQLNQLKTSFKEASRAVQLLARLKQPNTFCLFSDIGLYGLFSKLDKTSVLQPFTDNLLGKLQQHDTANKSQLITTLTAYLENNCSLSQTADHLAIHRNTLKYRLTRIEAITGKQLDNSLTRLELQTALFIKQLIL